MKKDKQFNTILDECLERILVGGETVSQCLERYPEYAAELESLLQTAMITSEAVDIQPSPEFKARARYQLQAEMAQADVKKKRSVFAWQPRWAMVVVTVMVVILLGSGTVLAASSDNTIPGNPLYAVKLVTENIRLAFASSDATKAQVYATLADRRMIEIEQLMERGKTELAQRTLARLNSHLEEISLLSADGQSTDGQVQPDEPVVKPDISVQAVAATVQAEERARLQVLWGRYIVTHPDEVRALLEEVPAAVKPALTRAIVDSVSSYVAVCQNAFQESKESQSNEQSSNSGEAPSTSNQQSGNSDQQVDNSNQQSGNSSLTPDASDLQSSTVK